LTIVLRAALSVEQSRLLLGESVALNHPRPCAVWLEMLIAVFLGVVGYGLPQLTQRLAEIEKASSEVVRDCRRYLNCDCARLDDGKACYAGRE
jgi:hypothetical protein